MGLSPKLTPTRGNRSVSPLPASTTSSPIITFNTSTSTALHAIIITGSPKQASSSSSSSSSTAAATAAAAAAYPALSIPLPPSAASSPAVSISSILFQSDIHDLPHYSPTLTDGSSSSRRRGGGPSYGGGGGQSYTPESSPLMGGRSPQLTSTSKNGRTTKRRCRLSWILILFVGLFLILLPAASRRAAQAALTSAGIPIPEGLISDRLHDLFESWDAQYDGDGSDDLTYVAHPLEEGREIEGVGGGKSHDEEEVMMTPHTFHENGHFIIKPFNEDLPPSTPHPIVTLIQKAEQDWNRKVRRQSRSLKDAAAEYRRRYTRNPPKGFDEWWAYARANKIVLTDEYNQIHKDLEPFWALEPSELLQRVQSMEVREDTFTISVTGGRVSLLGGQAYLRRAKDLGDLIGRFSAHLGDVNLTFTRHDQPAVQLGWYHKEKMTELAKMGEYFGPSDFVVEGDHTLSNWANGCPPDSPLRLVETAALNEPLTTPGSSTKFKSHSPAYITELSQQRSFIYDHQAAMDICQHPEIMPIHGFTTSPGTDAGPLVPLFTFAKTNIHSDVLVTPLEQYSDTYIGYDPDFKKKPLNSLLWRGSTTGAIFDSHSDWRASQRSRLHFMTHETAGTRKVLVEEEGRVKDVEMAMKQMNAKYMDVSFSGGPLQCDPETCALLKKVIDFRPTMGLDESYHYKYVIDLDGNGWSGRFHRLMSMKALVLKSTIFPEWYSDRIQPWLHYVPVKVDYTDIYDIMTFFRGTPEGLDAHEELAAKIGLSGKKWARDHWRKQDMAAYMFRLTLEWSRLLHRSDDESQDYTD